MTNLISNICLKCGRIKKVSAGSRLIACGYCIQIMVAKEEMKEKAVSGQYDWHATILAIRRGEKITQGALAQFLKVNPAILTYVKKGRKPIPPESLGIIKEKFSKYIKMK